MAMKLCAAAKHYYDPALCADCPYCGDAGSLKAAAPLSDGLTAAEHTAVLSAPAQDVRTQMVADPHAADQTAKTQIVANAAEDNARKTHIFGANLDADPEARAKGMSELPAAGWLVITEGAGRGTDFRLVRGANRIGRSAEMEVSLDFGSRSDPAVSRETHAAVIYDPHANEFFVERGSSRNLPLLNGSTIRGEPVLKNRDIIQVGDTKLVFVAFCGEGFAWE